MYEFKPVTKEIVLEMGEKTCASEPGKFCRMFATKNFGFTGFCLLYSKDLFMCPDTKVTLRCRECRNELGLI